MRSVFIDEHRDIVMSLSMIPSLFGSEEVAGALP